jgi:hypothetical protein
VTWQYWNGTTWTALTVADESNSFGRAYKSWITWTIPGDWATTVVNTDGRELYYIRAGVANPLINTLAAQAWLYGPPGGAAFKWNEYLTSFDQEGTTINIQKTSFVANSDTTNDPMAIEHTDPGTYLYDELNFSGNDYDIQTNINDEREDYYLFINADSFTQVIKAGQSFTTAGGTLAKVIFQLMRTGSTTTGYVVAKLYTHSGTYGTNSLPIGTPLAESARVDVTTISYVTPQQITFSFADNYYMEPGYYVITVEDDAGVQARVRTYRDSSTPTHSGNASIESSGTWTVLTGSDLVFAIYIGGTPKVVDFYSESNYTTDVQLRLSGASAYTDAGQTYIASGGKLTKATFYLQKVGAPTGTLYAYLYQYDGQIGDGGGGGGTYPTKTILSTSTGISAASISTTYSLVTFDFDAQFQTEPGQVYFIVVGISGGTSDASNYINCGRATLGHAGDLYGKYLTSTWIWFVTTDLIFYVWEGGEVDILSAESALDPSTYIINGDPPGVVNIDNAVYVYLSFVNEAGVAIDDVRVRLETDLGGDLLAQGDTDTASTFLYIYRYSSDQDIRIIVRKKGYKYQNIGATISNIGINLTVVLIRDEVVYLPG